MDPEPQKIAASLYESSSITSSIVASSIECCSAPEARAISIIKRIKILLSYLPLFLALPHLVTPTTTSGAQWKERR